MIHWLWLLACLCCIGCIAWYIYDNENISGQWFGFLLDDDKKIGDFFGNHLFIYFLVAFWGTAIPIVLGIYCAAKFLMSFD